MQSVNWVEVWQAIGLIFGTTILAIAARIGVKKSDGKPPPDRQPDPHELRQALYDLHSRMEQTGMDKATGESLKRSIDILASALERNTSACNAMGERIGGIVHAVQDLAKELEITSRMGRRHD